MIMKQEKLGHDLYEWLLPAIKGCADKVVAFSGSNINMVRLENGREVYMMPEEMFRQVMKN